MKYAWMTWPLGFLTLGAVGLIAMKKRAGWALQVAAQIAVGTYCILTEQYGFVPLNVTSATIAAAAFRSKTWKGVR